MLRSRRADRVGAVHVVVPAHDEAVLLPGALRSLALAIEHVREQRPQVRVGLTVVLDACTDESGRICVDAGVDVVEVACRNVGAARARGMLRAREVIADLRLPAEQAWIAHTDADSRVPVDWLTDQVDVAEAGHDVVLGRVEPDGTTSEAVIARWLTFHPPGHVGVHGANLGVRLSAYDEVGGFAPLPEREDLDLVKRLLAAGAREGAATRPVMTSSRLTGRTAGGFAGYLSGLASELASELATEPASELATEPASASVDELTPSRVPITHMDGSADRSD